MRKFIIVLLLSSLPALIFCQGHEVQQLLLNVEKLLQFKKILQNMKDGYQVLHKGYTTITNISEGNFSLHKTFLDALLEVSPAVRKYKRITDIVHYQLSIMKQQKGAFNYFQGSGEFTPAEIGYLDKVYRSLVKESVKNMDELSMVITPGRLRMCDEERLRAIDRIYSNIVGQYGFLKDFNNETSILELQRKTERANLELSKRMR